MMHTFIANNRTELVDRCKAKVAQRQYRAATEAQLANGVPLFIEQLERTLAAEEGGDELASLRISGSPGGDAMALSEMGVTATKHGKQLLELGFTVDQVVHDYGDLCQAITDLAVERDAPFGVDEFRTLNRCLDNAIADAVTEFSFQRDTLLARKKEREIVERVGLLAHELRSSVSAATLALGALQTANLSVSGATGGVLTRALRNMTQLIDTALAEVREKAAADHAREVFSVGQLIADAVRETGPYAQARSAAFTVAPVPSSVQVHANRERILAALCHLLRNAFRFTAPKSEVSLTTAELSSFVRIEVRDQCGGLPQGSIERMFSPFGQRSTDRSGLGMGLSIARESIEAAGGTLSVQDYPGSGCVFTISLPKH